MANALVDADVTEKVLASLSCVSCVVSWLLLAHQRSFSEDRPTRTSIIVMIQKRTTTWFSFQPFNS